MCVRMPIASARVHPSRCSASADQSVIVPSTSCSMQGSAHVRSTNRRHNSTPDLRLLGGASCLIGFWFEPKALTQDRVNGSAELLREELVRRIQRLQRRPVKGDGVTVGAAEIRLSR